MERRFEWDEKKNSINKAKHGISFEEAALVFADSFVLEKYDAEHSTLDEERFIRIGTVYNVLIVTVMFTDRDGVTRIISARAATPFEREEYYENIRNTFGT